MSAQAEPADGAKTPPTRWGALTANLENLGSVAAGLAAIVAVLYVVGAVVIGVRLGVRDLPSSAVVAQLPREFLLSTGLNVVLPAPAIAVTIYVSAGVVMKRSGARLVRNVVVAVLAFVVAAAGYSIWISSGLNDVLPAAAVGVALYIAAVPILKRSGERLVRDSVAVALVFVLVSAAYYVLKDPFPAKVCSQAGGAAAVGDFIGETGDRIYVGELRDQEGRRRIASVRVAGVSQVLIGGGAQQAPCPEAPLSTRS